MVHFDPVNDAIPVLARDTVLRMRLLWYAMMGILFFNGRSARLGLSADLARPPATATFVCAMCDEVGLEVSAGGKWRTDIATRSVRCFAAIAAALSLVQCAPTSVWWALEPKPAWSSSTRACVSSGGAVRVLLLRESLRPVMARRHRGRCQRGATSTLQRWLIGPSLCVSPLCLCRLSACSAELVFGSVAGGATLYQGYRGVAGDLVRSSRIYIGVQSALTILMVVFCAIQSGNLHGFEGITSRKLDRPQYVRVHGATPPRGQGQARARPDWQAWGGWAGRVGVEMPGRLGLIFV